MRRLFMVVFALLFMATQASAATGWVKGKPAGTDNPSTIDTSIGENNAALDLMLSNYRQDCKIVYSSASQLTVNSGGVMVSNSTGTVRLMLANSASTTVTWSDLDTGSEASSTTYYVYAIASATTDTAFTVKISASSTAPSGVTYYKRLGSFYNDASSNITQITNDNDTAEVGYVKGQGNYYQIDTGTASVSTGGTVSFSVTFSSTPIVVISALENEDSVDHPYSATTTGFSFRTNSGSPPQSVHWLAIGQILAQ